MEQVILKTNLLVRCPRFAFKTPKIESADMQLSGHLRCEFGPDGLWAARGHCPVQISAASNRSLFQRLYLVQREMGYRRVLPSKMSTPQNCTLGRCSEPLCISAI